MEVRPPLCTVHSLARRARSQRGQATRACVRSRSGWAVNFVTGRAALPTPARDATEQTSAAPPQRPLRLSAGHSRRGGYLRSTNPPCYSWPGSCAVRSAMPGLPARSASPFFCLSEMRSQKKSSKSPRRPGVRRCSKEPGQTIRAYVHEKQISSDTNTEITGYYFHPSLRTDA